MQISLLSCFENRILGEKKEIINISEKIRCYDIEDFYLEVSLADSNYLNQPRFFELEVGICTHNSLCFSPVPIFS